MRRASSVTFGLMAIIAFGACGPRPEEASCGGCLVDEVCYQDGDPAPHDPCLHCDSSLEPTSFVARDDGVSCDDGLFCTVNGVCEAGACVSVPRDCTGVDLVEPDCQVGICDELQRSCVESPANEGESCGDQFNGICSLGQCACVPLTCDDLGYECGEWDDGCGGETEDCGACESQHECDAFGECVCVPFACDDLGYECGSWDDGCGGETGICGTCAEPLGCNADGQCACVPLTCAELHYECGSWEDGCGGETEDCGPCSGDTWCASTGTCVPIPAGYVGVSSGSFTMGSPDDEPGRYSHEGPLHTVRITRSVFVKATPVTQSEWLQLMSHNPSLFSSCGLDCPVEQVSWWDAVAYTNALSSSQGLQECYVLDGCQGDPGSGGFSCTDATFAGLDCPGYRLPTDAEWEYAYRAGTTTAFYSGDITHIDNSPLDPNLDAIGWYSGNSGLTPHPVGLKNPNQWGLFDMSGNVREWVWDRFYRSYTSATQTDPLGPETGTSRVVRGGSWNNNARDCRAAARNGRDPDQRPSNLGFRPVRSAP